MVANNPFNPSFGGKPQYFFGREREIGAVTEALRNSNSPNRTLFFTGNRGCGKTALLERLSSLANDAGWNCIDVHSLRASESIVRKLVGGNSKFSERTVEPTIGFAGASVKAGALRTSTTTNYDALDLSDVLLDACKSLKHHEGIFITVDEVQKIPENDMENLCAAVQMSMRKGMPVALMLAGLPGSKELVSSYGGCTFMKRVSDVRLDSLLIDETYDAFRKLIALVPGIEATEESIDELARYSQGYPYLMQLIGFHTLEELPMASEASVVRLSQSDIEFAEPMAYWAFRANVLLPVVESLSDEQRAYLRAMGEAMDAEGKAQTSEVASLMGKSLRQLSTVRDRLLKKRVIAEGGWGHVRYNLPRMRQFFTDPFAEPTTEDENTWKHE